MGLLETFTSSYGITIITFLLLICSIRGDQFSTDPCKIFLGPSETLVEFLDEAADYRASNCQQMAEDMAIAWNIEGNTIKFEMHALTEGWVSIGINTGPSMRGADVAVGWVNGRGQAFLRDGKTDINLKEVPKVDESQDVELLNYRERDGFTSFLFSRPLISPDKEADRDIKGRVWIIWAHAKEDPDEDDWSDLAFHNREGATSIRFPLPERGFHGEL